MGEISLNIGYTPAQKKVFFECKKRFRTIAKGRRLGFTQGSANFSIEQVLSGKKGLWVDTISANIQRYYERYFMLVLKQLPSNMWSWEKQDKKLTCTSGGFLDMRGADRAENIEGFGYDFVILNEAGIILKNSYLWDNAVRPMLLDNPKSVALIGGVPKGKNRFYDLAQNGIKNDLEWEHFQFSSFDNPLLDKNEIEKMISELGGVSSPTVRQEVFGEFVDGTNNMLFCVSKIENAVQKQDIDDGGVEVWALDVARYGDDRSTFWRRSGHKIHTPQEFRNLNLTALSTEIYHRYLNAQTKPDVIFVDEIGMGAGVVDNLLTWGCPVVGANGASKPLEQRFLNKRAEMYFTLAGMMDILNLPHCDEMKKELLMMEYFYNDKGKLQIISKEDIKKTYGISPDYADGLAMLFYEKITPKEIIKDDWSGNGW